MNHELIKDGWSWRYQKYAPGDTVLEGLEINARKEQRGQATFSARCVAARVGGAWTPGPRYGQFLFARSQSRRAAADSRRCVAR